MKILFASGDVGGARAVVPVIAECARRGIPFWVMNHGHIVHEIAEDWDVLPTGALDGSTDVTAQLRDLCIGALVFTASVSDTAALRLARHVRTAGLPVFFLLDNWTGYTRQMTVDGLAPFVPDRFFVMDSIARDEAVRDGVEASTVRIVGHPALAALAEQCDRHRAGDSRGKTAGEPVRLLFVSEPAASDQGTSAESPTYRGYTEHDVLRSLCHALSAFSARVHVGLLPHPREDAALLMQTWRQAAGELTGELIQVEHGRDALFDADGVVGMASILLYEAWLLGKPVLSLQPGLRLPVLRTLSMRKGLSFVDDYDQVDVATHEWVSKVLSGQADSPSNELAAHACAAQSVVDEIVASLSMAGAATSEGNV